jgi:preprotein translocase subunit SecD
MSRRASIIALVVVIIVTAGFTYLGINGIPLGRYDFLPFSKSIVQGLDLRGGVYAVYTPKDESESNMQEKLDTAMMIMRNRLDQQNYTEATIAKQGFQNNQIRVEIPGVSDPDQVFKLIGTPAKLQFMEPEERRDLARQLERVHHHLREGSSS